jgi:hypothetical protein
MHKRRREGDHGSSPIPYTLLPCCIPLRIDYGLHVCEKFADQCQCHSNVIYTCMYCRLQTAEAFELTLIILQKVRSVMPISHMVDALTPLTCRIADKGSDVENCRKSVDEQPSPSNDQANLARTQPQLHLHIMMLHPTRPFCRCNRIQRSSELLSAASLTIDPGS